MSHSNSKVLDLGAFRAKKQTEEELSLERTPLYVSHKEGTIKGSPHFRRPSEADFGDRIQRIRHSLERINALMVELKNQSNRKKD